MLVVDCGKVPRVLHVRVYASSGVHLRVSVAGKAANDQDDEGGEAVLGIPEAKGGEPAVVLQVGEYVDVEDGGGDAPRHDAFDCVGGLDMALEERQEEGAGGDDDVLVEAEIQVCRGPVFGHKEVVLDPGGQELLELVQLVDTAQDGFHLDGGGALAGPVHVPHDGAQDLGEPHVVAGQLDVEAVVQVEDVFARKVDVHVVELHVDRVPQVGAPDGVHDEDGPPQPLAALQLRRRQERQLPVQPLDEGGPHRQAVEGEGGVGAVEALQVERNEDQRLHKLQRGLLVRRLVQAHRGHVEAHSRDVARRRVRHVLLAHRQRDEEVADPQRLLVSQPFVGLVDLCVQLLCVKEVVLVSEERHHCGHQLQRVRLVREHHDSGERRVQRRVLEEVPSLRQCPCCRRGRRRLRLPRDGK